MLQFKHNPRGPYGEGFSAAHAGYLYSYWLDEDETGTFYQADIYSREDRDDDDHLLEDQQFNTEREAVVWLNERAGLTEDHHPMSTQHTPGPWSCDTGTDGAVIYDPSAGTIAQIPDDLSAHLLNARLIAAAPELLAALARLLDWAEDVAAERDERPGCVDAARAAIARATGAQEAKSCA